MNDFRILRLANVSKSFGGVRAVEDISFEVRSREIVAVIGPNGAGKTTLFNLVTGMFPPTSGEIFTSGDYRIHKLPPYKIARLGFARTFQNLQVFSGMTVLENVMTGCHKRGKVNMLVAALRLPWVAQEETWMREAALQELEFVGLAHRAHDNAADLPYGQQRLLEIARALVTQPKLILLDEPAAGLGPRETEMLVVLVRRINERGVTVALIEHDMGMVMNIADRIIVLDYGRLLAEGTPAEIRQNPKVIAAYLGEEVLDAAS
jgi:ABC-type branched-subunit amino acid transport system ATPase component